MIIFAENLLRRTTVNSYRWLWQVS